MLSAQHMVSAQLLSSVLSVAVISLEVAVWYSLRRRNLSQDFPVLTVYVAFHIIKAAYLLLLRIPFALREPTILGIPARSYYSLYFYSYWPCAVVMTLLTLAVIFELYGHVFRRYPHMERFGRRLLHGVAACLLLMGIVAAARLPVNVEFTRRVQALNAAITAMDVVRLGLLLFLFLFAAYFRLRWSNQVFGVAVGMALYLSSELGFQGIEVRFGQSASLAYAFVTGSAYIFSLLIWLRYIHARVPIGDQSFEPPLHDLGLWNDAMAGMLK